MRLIEWEVAEHGYEEQIVIPKEQREMRPRHFITSLPVVSRAARLARQTRFLPPHFKIIKMPYVTLLNINGGICGVVSTGRRGNFIGLCRHLSKKRWDVTIYAIYLG